MGCFPSLVERPGWVLWLAAWTVGPGLWCWVDGADGWPAWDMGCGDKMKGCFGNLAVDRERAGIQVG